jgi:hypothetical protein
MFTKIKIFISNYRKLTISLIALVLVFSGSLLLNYSLLKKFYVIRCAEGGMLMEKATCDKFAQKNFELIEQHRQEVIANNPDLFGGEDGETLN